MKPATLHWASATHSGSRKPRNDDSQIAFASSVEGAEILPDRGVRSLSTQDLIFAISDGMGGGNAGDLASRLLLETMTRIIPETFKAAAAGFFPDHLEHLSSAVRTVHQEVNRAGAESDDLKGMAATLALAWFTPENLYLANAGDSRIYLSREGNLSQISRDHTAAWAEWKRGTIGEVQYRNHPRRAALYEVIGGGHANLSPHLAAIPYQEGDRFLICSDGLIDGLWERHISNALAACEEDPSATVEGLMKRAIDNSGIDDTTVTVIAVATNKGGD
ncbi:serine/threonine-protein phosphatase [Luteolibacter pohnpeiensis]|uniref:Serine/threonine-protein phosphatase n=1 Tax=Luteolibacter pohnpeiensis TaxID=454153 RepID=A0A934VWL6_9BACT|nr:PP2C family serine/threonine-protein phosphatase [Luteolibacter pohnpeiensis]MBK1882634.1 serine/threonine-protein phosphatase [Luteolibacter pohnpeiensis]